MLRFSAFNGRVSVGSIRWWTTAGLMAALSASLLVAVVVAPRASADAPATSGRVGSIPRPLTSAESQPVARGVEGQAPVPVPTFKPVVGAAKLPALAKRTGFDAATSTVESRAQFETVYRNADGTRTSIQTTNPSNYLDPQGVWQPVKNALIADPDRAGGYTNTANAWRVHFGSLRDGMAFETSAGTVSVAAAGASAVAPTVDADGVGVTYAEAWPGADLTYEVNSAAVKETVLIKSASAGSSFSFTVRSGTKKDVLAGKAGVPALAAHNGGLALPGPVGAAVSLDAPVVLTAQGDMVPEAKASLTQVGSKVVLSVDPQWLAAQPASAFPIRLDPTVGWTTGWTGQWSYRSDGQSCSFCASGVQVGNSRDGGNTYWRSVAQFPTNVLAGTTILDSRIVTSAMAGSGNGYVMNAYIPTANSYAGSTGSGTVIASGTPATLGYIDGVGLTNYLQTVANASAPNALVGFIGNETAGAYTYQGFGMTLAVTYNHIPTTPVLQAPANGSSFHSMDGLTAVKASSTDGDSDPIRYLFTLSTSADMQQVFATSWNDTNVNWWTWTIDPSFFNTSTPKTVYWQVYAFEWNNNAASPAYGAQSPASAVWSFTPTDSAPSTVPVSGMVPADTSVVATTTPTLSVPAQSDADGDTVSYNFTISGGGDAPAGRASSGWQTGTTWTVPSGVLDDGQAYTWTVTTGDGPPPTRQGAWKTAGSLNGHLTVNLRLGQSSVAATDAVGGVTANLANGNVFVSVAGHSMATAGGSLGVGLSYNSQATSRVGLLGQYYADYDGQNDFSTAGSAALVRVDPTVNFAWPDQQPPTGLPVSNYLVKWTGYLTVPVTGSYQLGLDSDDGSRLLVNGTNVLDSWGGLITSPPILATAQTFTAGVPVKIEVDYYNKTGPGRVTLFQTQTGAAGAVAVPSSWLSPGLATLPAGWTLSLPGDAASYTHAAAGNGVVVLTDSDGQSHSYVANGSGGFTPPPGEDGTLSTVTSSSGGQSYTLTDSDGSIYVFDDQGNPTSSVSKADPLHPAAATYTYDTSVTPARVSTISDPATTVIPSVSPAPSISPTPQPLRSIKLRYGGDSACNPSPMPSGYDTSIASSLLCKVEYWDGSSTYLLYSQGKLAAVVEPGNATTQFGYQAQGLLSSVKSPLAVDWQNVDPTNRGTAPVTTDIAYTFLAAAASGTPSNVRPAATVATPNGSGVYPAGSIPVVSSITGPSKDGSTTAAARVQHTYGYIGTNESRMAVTGLGAAGTTIRDVTYDTTGRTTLDTTATGQQTSTVWNPNDTPASTTDAAGRVTNTLYDWANRAVDTYGPAPSSAGCFQASGVPVASPPAACGLIPHTHTGYDTDTTGTRLAGLEGAGYTNTTLSGAPAVRGSVTGLTAVQETTLGGAGSSSRYSGELALPATSSTDYTFGATVGDPVNDGVRVYVDDQVALDRWLTGYQAIKQDAPTAWWRLADLGTPSTVAAETGPSNGVPTVMTWGAVHGPSTVDPAMAGTFAYASKSRITVPTASSLDPAPSGAFSIDAWVKPNTINHYQMIATKMDSSVANSTEYEFSIDDQGRPRLVQAGNGSLYVISTAAPLTAGTWSHVAVTKTSTGKVQLYINGSLQPLLTTNNPTSILFPATVPNLTKPLIIGQRDDLNTNYGFDGQMADVAFYQTTLTSNQIATEYSGAKATLQGTATRTFVPSTLISGATPHKFRVEYRNPTAAANFTLTATPTGGGAAVTITGAMLNPRYGLSTYSKTDDSGGSAAGAGTTPGKASGQTTAATSYTGSGLSAAYGLATDQIVDPAGLALDTKTAYETPGTGYLRVTANALPSAALGTSAQTRATTYYATTDTATNPCTSGTPTPTPTASPATAYQGGLVKTVTDPAPATGTAIVHTYIYDAAGRVIATRNNNDAAGAWTCTTYDQRSRVTTVTYPAANGAAARTVTTQYNDATNPLVSSVSDPTGTITTTVDLAGRVTSYTDVKGTTTTTTYDQAGRATQQTTTTAGGTVSTLTTAYLNDGRTSSISLDGLTIAVPTYNSTTAELTGVTYPTGTGNGGNGAASTITKNPQGTQTGVSYALPGSHTVADTTTVSQASRVLTDAATKDSVSVSSWAYAYDSAARLTSGVLAANGAAPAVTYTYNYAGSGGCGADTAAGKDGSRTSSVIAVSGGASTTTTSCVDYAGRLTSTTGTGAMTAVYNSHGDATTLGTNTFTYDQADRVVAGSSTSGGVTQNATYGLDSTGRLVTRTASGTGTGVDTSSSTYSYTGDGDTADLQLTGSNTIGERYLSLPGGVLYTKRYANTGGDTWALPNVHGDTLATTTGAGVIIGACAVYDPYGNPLNPTTGLVNLASDPSTRNTGLTDGWEGSHQRAAEHTGTANWILMGARIYLPGYGQFASTDPKYGGNTNTYNYPTDPINGSDLNGMCGWSSPLDCVKSLGRGIVKYAPRAGKFLGRLSGVTGAIFGGIAIYHNPRSVEAWGAFLGSLAALLAK